MTCAHPTRIPLKIKLISNLWQLLATLPSDPILSDIVLDGINSAITPHPLSPSRYPAAYRLLITTQTGIGWINFLWGFVSNEWSRLHHLFLHCHSLPSSTPDALSCLQLVLTHLSHIWKFCNHQRHSSTSSIHISELIFIDIATLSYPLTNISFTSHFQVISNSLSLVSKRGY